MANIDVSKLHIHDINWFGISWMNICNVYTIATVLIRLPFLVKYAMRNRDTGGQNVEQILEDKSETSLSFFALYFAFMGSLLANSYDLPVVKLQSMTHIHSICGLVLASLHVFLLVWAHKALGSSYSPTIATQTDHCLVVNGPYKYARHPLYAATVLRPICVFLLTHNWLFALCWFPTVVCALSRVKREEALLLRIFREQYAEYKLKVGAFWPWRPFNADFGLTDLETAAIMQSLTRKKDD